MWIDVVGNMLKDQKTTSGQPWIIRTIGTVLEEEKVMLVARLHAVRTGVILQFMFDLIAAAQCTTTKLLRAILAESGIRNPTSSQHSKGRQDR